MGRKFDQRKTFNLCKHRRQKRWNANDGHKNDDDVDDDDDSNTCPELFLQDIAYEMFSAKTFCGHMCRIHKFAKRFHWMFLISHPIFIRVSNFSSRLMHLAMIRQSLS